MRLPPNIRLFLLLLWCLLGATAAQQTTWYAVETEVLICADVKSVGFRVTIPQTAPKKDTPHVLTFFRTSNKSVTVTYDVVDANRKTVVKKQTVDLQALTGRRLDESRAPVEDDFMAEFEELEVEEDAEYEDEDDVAWATQPWRRLSSRRRGGGGGGSSSRSRSSTSTSSSRKSPSPSPSSTGGARRRANPTAARRRGSQSDGKTQPSTGVGGSRFQNSNGQSWAYTSQSRLSSNYGGRTPKTTSYGYAGQNAYTSPSSGRSNMAMYAGAGLVGGVVVGAGAMYLASSSSSYSRYSRYGRGNDYCSLSSGSWSGSCSECYQRYGDQCVQEGPRGSANRDDLMETGFWPADWKSPLTVTIFSVTGEDFVRSRICPPSGWNQHDGTMALPGSDLFLTLTEMSELEDKLEQDGSAGGVIVGVLVLICCCCCCFAIICFVVVKMSSQAAKVGTDVGGRHVTMHDQPVTVQGTYAQPVVEASYVQPMHHGQQPAVVVGSPVQAYSYQPGQAVG